MQHPFEVLRPEYESLLAGMVVTRASEVDETARRLLRFIDAGRYKPACDASNGIPQPFAAASFEREGGSNFRLNPAQGAPLDERSKMIPHNGPFSSWTQAAIAAYRIDHLDAVGDWIWARACYEGEAFNGFGYRARGVHTPYLWAGTNVYRIGKFDRDGHFVSEVDAQLGIVPVMKRIIELRPALDLAAAVASRTAEKIKPPEPLPEGVHDAHMLQDALNQLFAKSIPGRATTQFSPNYQAEIPLMVDGSYGRKTRRVVEAFQAAHHLKIDGLAGAATWSAINEALAA